MMPNRKVGAGAIAGAITAIIVWAVSQRGITIPGEVAAAITTLLAFVTSYFVPEPTP